MTRQEVLEEREMLKRDRFWNFFTMTTAITYGIGLVMLGCVFYLADIFISYEDATTISSVNFFPTFTISSTILQINFDRVVVQRLPLRRRHRIASLAAVGHPELPASAGGLYEEE